MGGALRRRVLASLLSIVLGTSATADTGTSLGAGGGEGGGPFAGLLQSPEANLFSGGLSQTLSIRIPPGRKTATPDLKLVYSSGGGSGGAFGEGWSMPLGAIERSTKWGVPRCTGSTGFDATDEFVLTLNGAALELVNFGPGPSGSTVYRPRTDQSFLEAVHKTDDTWEVLDRSGMTYVFGTAAESKRVRQTTCGFTAVWGLTKIDDTHSNRILYKYLTGKDALLLDFVRYGGTLADQAFRVRFEYIAHTDPMESYRSGVYERIEDLVDRIYVEAKAAEGGSFLPVRTYDLEYDHEYGGSPPTGCSAARRALLCEVSVDDGLPTQRFEYAPSDFGMGLQWDVQAGPNQYSHLRNSLENANTDHSVMDINGDGRLDYLRADNDTSNSNEVFYGLATGGISGSASIWSTTGATVGGGFLRDATPFDNSQAYTRKETMDITGDGIADFVDAFVGDGNPWRVYRGSLDLGPGPGFEAVSIPWAAPVEFLGHDERHTNSTGVRTWKRLADMNGDGRPDLVIAGPAPAQWAVYLNNGLGFVDTGTGATDLTYGLSATSGPISDELKTNGVRRTLRDLFDFNGDGLPDAVVAGVDSENDPAYLLYLNDGQTFIEPPIEIKEPAGENAVRAVHNNSGDTTADFVDLNGDGLPDRVVDTGSSWSVRVNLGTSLAAAQTWPGGDIGPIRSSNGTGNTKIDVVDWDHDGFVDRVDARSGGNWQIDLGKPLSGSGVRPYLMTAAHNGLGGTTYPTYQPSTRYDNTLLPFVTWVVTETRRTDGLCSDTPGACLGSGNEIQRRYTYADGYFDGPTREFRGFGYVKETFPFATTSSSCSGFRETLFNQADHTRGQIDVRETFARAWSFNGCVSRHVSRETNVWQTGVDGPRTQVFLAEKKSEEFDHEDPQNLTPQCRMERNEPPDVYGRVATRCSLPCGTSAPGDCSANTVGKVTTSTVWANPPGNPGLGDYAVRERPSSVSVSYVKPGGATEQVSKQTFSYVWPSAKVINTTTEGDATTGGNAEVLTGYGTFGNTTSVTDAEGGQSTAVFSGTPFDLFPSSESNAAGHTVQTTWDLRYGKPTQVVGPNGEVTVATYDAAGRTKCEAEPGQSCSGVSPVPSVEYSYVYGDPGAGTFEGKLSYVETKTREPSNTTGPLPGYLLSRSYFDALGRQRATATWRVVGSGNDLVWVVAEQINYLPLARNVYPPYQAGLAGTGLVGLIETPTLPPTEYRYNVLGWHDPTERVRWINYPDETSLVTRYAGEWTHVTDQEGNKTSTKADFRGREVSRLLHEGSSTLKMQYDYTYDGLDRLLTTTVGVATVTNVWDPLGRKQQVMDPDSGTWESRYDKNGNTTLQQDPEPGQHLEACYDAISRIVLQCSYTDDNTTAAISCGATPSCGTGGTEVARYTYDTQPVDVECGGPGMVGQLTEVVDTSGSECFAYDTRGRVTKQKKTIDHNGLATTARTGFSYDDADHLEWISYPDSGLIPHGYQADGLPDSIDNLITDVEYDLFGRATRILSARDTEELYGYDTTGYNHFRLETIQTKRISDGAVYLNLDHTYWAGGKVKRVVDHRDFGTSLSNAADYCYDGLGRLTEVDRDPTGPSSTCGGIDESFVHDAKGNLTAKNGSAFGFAAGPHQVTSFGSTYSSIEYDNNGNRTLKSQGGGTEDEFLYDARGLLVEVKRWTSGTVSSSQTNVYDYAGARVVRAPSSGAGTTIRTYNRYADAGGGNLTKYFYLGDRLIGSWTSSAPSLSEVEPDLLVPPSRIELPPELLVPGAALVLVLLLLPLGRRRALGVRVSLARVASVSVVFLTASFPVVIVAGCGAPPPVRVFHVDHLGSTQVVTDYNGAIYRQMRYFAYGELRGRFNAAGDPVGYAQDARFEFTGYESDFAGLDYAGARFFDPELAQFGSHDPAGQFPSPYTYGAGDPVNTTDPTGAFVEYLIVAAVILVQAAINAAVAAFIDTYASTGSARAGVKAAGHAAANGATFGVYGGVKAISNDEYGDYLADFYANVATAGVYGTVRSFNDGQIATGLVSGVYSAAVIASLAQGVSPQGPAAASGLNLGPSKQPGAVPLPTTQVLPGIFYVLGVFPQRPDVVEIPFSSLDTGIGPEQFPGFIRASKELPAGSGMSFIADQRVDNGSLGTGTSTLELGGHLEKSPGGRVSFSGRISARREVFNFDKGGFANRVGRNLPGRQFDVQFVGRRRVSFSK